MSIKGIDNQIMVQRTAEYVRDSSTMNRHAELLQDKNAVIGERLDLQKQQTVVQTNEPQDVKLDKDKHGAAQYEGGRGKKKRKSSPPENEPEKNLPGDKPYKIDILV